MSEYTSIFSCRSGKTIFDAKRVGDYVGLFPLFITRNGVVASGWEDLAAGHVLGAGPDLGLFARFKEVMDIDQKFDVQQIPKEDSHWMSTIASSVGKNFNAELHASLVEKGQLSACDTVYSRGTKKSLGAGVVNRMDHPIVKVIIRGEKSDKSDTLWFMTGIPEWAGGTSYLVQAGCPDKDLGSIVIDASKHCPHTDLAEYNSSSAVDAVLARPYYFLITNAFLLVSGSMVDITGGRVFALHNRDDKAKAIEVMREHLVASRSAMGLTARMLEKSCVCAYMVAAKGKDIVAASSAPIVMPSAEILITDDLW
jgi:hypothetical protein